jgi:hypothetical protein
VVAGAFLEFARSSHASYTHATAFPD